LRGHLIIKVDESGECGRGFLRHADTHASLSARFEALTLYMATGRRFIVPHLAVLPRAGEILLWPALLHHLVHPNRAKETPISVSFNIMLKWQDSYLP
jgi:hypothetical protein